MSRLIPSRTAALALLTAAVGAGVLALLSARSPASADSSPAATTLREAAQGHFLVGCAVQSADLDDPKQAALVASQFDCLTAENEMKPDALQAQKGVFTFEAADRIVAFAQAHDMRVIGHNLLWHQQSPKWMFEGADGKPLPREEALANLKTHIQTVVRHFKGRVHGWDVVNEAVDDSGPYLRDTPALRAIGEDYVARAFQFAREADPDVELYYNDYNIEVDYKRDKAVRLLESLEAAGVRPDALGIQGHWLIGSPETEEIERGIQKFKGMGYKLMFTEVDVDPLPRGSAGADINATEQGKADPYPRGLPPDVQTKLADRYGELMRLIMKYDADVTRVSFWGTYDGTSWLNDFPVRGRTNHPLLFDRDRRPKPAFTAVIDAIAGKSAE